MSNALEFATLLVARLPLSPQQRVALGAAMICDVVSTANEEYPAVSPFMGVTVDENEPFKTVIAALTVLDNLPPDHPLAI